MNAPDLLDRLQMGSEKLDWRPMTATDLDQVVAIELKSRPSPWTRSAFESDLKVEAPPRLFVLCQQSRVIGYLDIWMIADELHVQNIVVDPVLQGKGLGSWIFAKGMQIGIALGCQIGYLDVRESNTAAITLYERFGFQSVALRKAYYADGENALLMTRHGVDKDEFRKLVTKQLDEIEIYLSGVEL